MAAIALRAARATRPLRAAAAVVPQMARFMGPSYAATCLTLRVQALALRVSNFALAFGTAMAESLVSPAGALGTGVWAIKRTFQPSVISRKRKHGFLRRIQTTGGRNVIARRIVRGRKRISC